MVEGREAIKKFWRDAVTGLDVRAVRLETLDVTQAGEMLIEVARGEISVAGNDQPIAIKYVVAWRRENGAWLWHVDIWNMSS